MKHLQLEEENKTLKASKTNSESKKSQSREATPLETSAEDESSLDLSEVPTLKYLMFPFLIEIISVIQAAGFCKGDAVVYVL
jgi:hypothetical protein